MPDDPKGSVPDNSGNTDTPAPVAPANADTANAGNADWEAKLTAESQARGVAEKRYTDLRREFDRRNAQPRVTEPNPQQPQPPADQWGARVSQPDSGASGFTAYDRENLDVVRFKQDTKDWNDHWKSVQEIINDPVRVHEVAIMGPNQQVDTYRSLQMAHLKVKNAVLESARDQAKADKVKLDDERKANNAKAVISGTGASELPDPDLDLNEFEKLGYKEMEKSGKLPIDPNDPPSFARR